MYAGDEGASAGSKQSKKAVTVQLEHSRVMLLRLNSKNPGYARGKRTTNKQEPSDKDLQN